MSSGNTDEQLLNQLYKIQSNAKLNYKQISILLELQADYQKKIKEAPDDKVLKADIKVIESYLSKD
tara:strand:- start:593 stop:790 length:198 start_codon:yes stop_codon:yes gene_type:complete